MASIRIPLENDVLVWGQKLGPIIKSSLMNLVNWDMDKPPIEPYGHVMNSMNWEKSRMINIDKPWTPLTDNKLQL